MLLVLFAVDCTTTWYWTFPSTGSTLDWDKFMASFGTFEGFNFTTLEPWWIITTTTGEFLPELKVIVDFKNSQESWVLDGPDYLDGFVNGKNFSMHFYENPF